MNGSSQPHIDIFAAVRPSAHRPSVLFGKLANGQRGLCSYSKCANKARRNSGGMPARMPAAYIRSGPSKYPTRIESSVSPLGMQPPITNSCPRLARHFSQPPHRCPERYWLRARLANDAFELMLFHSPYQF
jgi:hypothetical protein